MAFCPKCGKPFEENAVNCAYCGARNPQAPAPKVNEIVNKAKSINKKNISILASVLALIVIAIVLVVSIFGNKHGKVIDKYFKLTYGGEQKLIEELAPEQFWEKLEKKTGAKYKDIEEVLEAVFDSENEDYEEDYGKNIKVKFDIVEKEKYDEDDLEDVKDFLKERFGIPRKSISAAYDVEIEYTIEGDDDEKNDEATFELVKIDGKWYIPSLFDTYNSFASILLSNYTAE